MAFNDEYPNYTFNNLATIGHSYNSTYESFRRISIIDLASQNSTEKARVGQLYTRLFVLETSEAISQLTKAAINLNVKSASYKANAEFRMAASSLRSSESITLAQEYIYISSKESITADAPKSSVYSEFLRSLRAPDSTVNHIDFYGKFGDFIVSDVFYGTRIIVLITLKTQDENEKNSIISSFSGSYNGVVMSGRLSANFEQTFEKCRSTKSLEVSIIGKGNFNPDDATTIANNANDGNLSSGDILKSIKNLIDHPDGTEDVPIFSILLNIKDVATETTEREVPRLNDYADDVLPLWRIIQDYNWAIETVTDIQTGIDHRWIGVSEEDVRRFKDVSEQWKLTRDRLIQQFDDIPECISSSSRNNRRCFEADIPLGVPRTNIIPSTPFYILDSELIYDNPELTTYNNGNVNEGFTLFTLSNKGKGYPREKYKLSLSLIWNTHGYPYDNNPTVGYAISVELFVNGILWGILHAPPVATRFNEKQNFGPKDYDIEADDAGKCEVRLSIVTKYRSGGPESPYVNANLEFIKDSFMTLERKNREQTAAFQILS